MNYQEIDKLVAEKVMGENLKPHRDLAMAAIGKKYVMVTGPVFQLTTGEKLPLPRDLDELRKPTGSSDINDRYYLYVAEFLGERIADEVDSYRLSAKPYSTNIQHAWLVVEKLESQFSSVEIHLQNGMINVIITEHFENGYLKNKYQGYEKSASLSICKAALKAVGVEAN